MGHKAADLESIARDAVALKEKAACGGITNSADETSFEILKLH